MAPRGPPKPEPPAPDLGAPLARSGQLRPNNYTRTIRGVGLENMTLITKWSWAQEAYPCVYNSCLKPVLLAATLV